MENLLKRVQSFRVHISNCFSLTQRWTMEILQLLPILLIWRTFIVVLKEIRDHVVLVVIEITGCYYKSEEKFETFVQTTKITEPVKSCVHLSIEFKQIPVHLIIYGEMDIVTVFIRSFTLVHNIESFKHIFCKFVCMQVHTILGLYLLHLYFIDDLFSQIWWNWVPSQMWYMINHLLVIVVVYIKSFLVT